MADPKRVTIKDIAEAAGVSLVTVSRVINDMPGVSDENRKRIKAIMRDMRYQPNRAAQMMHSDRSNMVEVIMLDVEYGGSFAQSAKTMAHTAKEAGFSLLVSDTTSDDFPQVLDHAAAQSVDGIVLYAPQLTISDEELNALCRGIPLVRRDYCPGSHIPWVGFDQTYATTLAIQHLIDLGHWQIAEISAPLHYINPSWRHRRWLELLKVNDLEPGPHVEGGFGMRGGYEAARRLLAQGVDFTALFAHDDNLAMGAMHAIREHRLRIPDDISIIGLNNAEYAPFLAPPLTTVEFEFQQQDSLTVKYLIELIESPDIERHQRLLMPNLIVRESTRPLV